MNKKHGGWRALAWAGSQRSLGWLQHRWGGPYWKGDGHHLGRGQAWQRAPGGVFERATFRNGRNMRNEQQDNKSRTRTRKGQCGNTLEKEFKEWGVSHLRAPREVRRHDRQRHSLYPALASRYRRWRPWCRRLGRKQVERCASN